MDELSDDDLSPPPHRANHALRQALLEQTTRVVRRRYWLRRGAYAAALAACYVAGLLTTRPDPRPTVPDPPAEGEVSRDPVPPRHAAGPRADLPGEAPANVLEQWGPLVSADRRASLYRRAGDRYLAESNDMQAALRCYRNALDAAPEDLDVDATDTWLLMSLKEARSKERRDGKTN